MMALMCELQSTRFWNLGIVGNKPNQSNHAALPHVGYLLLPNATLGVGTKEEEIAGEVYMSICSGIAIRAAALVVVAPFGKQHVSHLERGSVRGEVSAGDAECLSGS